MHPKNLRTEFIFAKHIIKQIYAKNNEPKPKYFAKVRLLFKSTVIVHYKINIFHLRPLPLWI